MQRSENIIPSTPTLAATIHALLAELIFLTLELFGDGMNELGFVAHILLGLETMKRK